MQPKCSNCKQLQA